MILIIVKMLKFYLRQTIPFNIIDLPMLFKYFFSNIKNLNIAVKTEVKKNTHTKYIVLSKSMRSVLLKSLEFFRIQNPKKNEVLLPEYSFHSNLSSAIKAGFEVKFVPVDKKTLFIDEKKLEKLITKKTLGIIITHMHGQIYNLDKIKKIIDKHHLIVFEDCAHSFPLKETPVKSNWQINSTIKCLSFGPGKFITAFGGGALATNNKDLFKHVSSSTIKNKSIIKECIILIKTYLYVFISSPLISHFTIKPFLGFAYLLKTKKSEDESFDQSTTQSTQIEDMSNFQQKLLFLQLKKLRFKTSEIIDKRKENAKTWHRIFKGKKISSEFCFQFPVIIDDQKKFIWQMWQQNIDVQKDYCSYLPKLIENDSFSKKDSEFFEKIVYLPTNQYLSVKHIQKIKF